MVLLDDYLDANLEAVMNVRRSRDRFEALKRLGFRAPTPLLEHVVTEIIRWKYERRGPWPWHYMIRAYRRMVLARKDWRLPWR